MLPIFKKKTKEQPQFTEIGKETFFEGTIFSKTMINIYGKVKGKVESATKVETFPFSLVEGEVLSSLVITDGEIKGEIKSESELIIKKGSKIEGKIVCKKLKVESGAYLEGSLKPK